MPLNVDLNKSSPNLFHVVFPNVPYQQPINESNEFVLNVFGAIIPGLSLAELTGDYQGLKSSFASTLTFDTWNVDFVVDNKFRNWRMLYNWIMYIHNNQDKAAEVSDRYKIDAVLVVLSPYQKPVINIKFERVWPISLTSVNMNMRDGDAILECNVSFAYTRFGITSADGNIRLSDI